MRLITTRRVLAVCAIALIQAWVAISTFAAVFALGDGRRPVPAWLSIAANVLTLPGFLILGPQLQAFIGDPAEIYLAATIDGLLWGVAIVGLTVWWRHRRPNRTVQLLDQYAPDLAARLGALSLEARRRVITNACLVMSARIDGIEAELRSLIEAAANHTELSREELATVRAFAETAYDRYLELQSNAANSSESLRCFLNARLGTALATAFGSSDPEAAADAAYELCVLEDDAKITVGTIEAAIDRVRRAE